MSEGRLGRRDYFGADGWLRCGCGARMCFVDGGSPDDDDDDDDGSYAYCPSCNDNYYDASANMMRADPVTNPRGWRSMIDTVLATGMEFEQPWRTPWAEPPNGYAANAFVVAFHLMALEAQ